MNIDKVGSKKNNYNYVPLEICQLGVSHSRLQPIINFFRYLAFLAGVQREACNLQNN